MLKLLLPLLSILLFTACSQKEVQVVKKKEPTLIVDTLGHTAKIWDILVTNDKSELITGSEDNTIRVWDAYTGKEKRKIWSSKNNGAILAIALTNDNKYLVSAGQIKDYMVNIFDYKTGKLFKSIKTMNEVIFDISFSNDDKYLIASFGYGDIQIWDTKNWNLILTKKLHEKNIPSVSMIKNSSNTYNIYTSSEDKTIKLHKFNNKELTFVNQYRSKSMFSHHDISSNGDIAVIEGNKITILTKVLIEKASTKSYSHPLISIKYSPNGKKIAFGADAANYPVRIIDVDKNYSSESFDIIQKEDTFTLNFIDNERFVVAGDTNYNLSFHKTKKMNPPYLKSVNHGLGIFSLGILNNKLAWGNYYRSMFIKDRELDKYFNLNNYLIKEITNQDNFDTNTLKDKKDNWSLTYKEDKDESLDRSTLLIKNFNKIHSKIKNHGINGRVINNFTWYKKYIITSALRGHINIYNKEGKLISKLIGHTSNVKDMVLDKDLLFTAGRDKIIRVWDLNKINQDKEKELDTQKIKYVMKLRKVSEAKAMRIIQKFGESFYKPQYIEPKLNIFITKDNEYVIWGDNKVIANSPNATKFINYLD